MSNRSPYGEWRFTSSRLDRERLELNLNAAIRLLETIQHHGGQLVKFPSGRSLNQSLHGYRDVPAEFVLQFLEQYAFAEEQRELSRELLSTYVTSELRQGSLYKWRVVVMEGPNGEKVDLPGIGHIGSVLRSRLSDTHEDLANIRILTSAEDRVAGIDWDPGETPPKGADLLIERCRRHPREGILRLYFIDRTSAPTSESQSRAALDAATTVVGISVDFPDSSSPDVGIGYVIADVPGAQDLEEEEIPDAADRADEEELDDAD